MGNNFAQGSNKAHVCPMDPTFFPQNTISQISNLTLSLPESVVPTIRMVLTFESVDEILWCDHSNETSSAVLSHGTIYI